MTDKEIVLAIFSTGGSILALVAALSFLLRWHALRKFGPLPPSPWFLADFDLGAASDDIELSEQTDRGTWRLIVKTRQGKIRSVTIAFRSTESRMLNSKTWKNVQ